MGSADGSPRPVTFEGSTWCAIPPNPRRVVENIEGRSGYVTFTTHWPDEQVTQPGETFTDTRVKQGDWVFYLSARPADMAGVRLLDALMDDAGNVISAGHVAEGIDTSPNDF